MYVGEKRGEIFMGGAKLTKFWITSISCFTAPLFCQAQNSAFLQEDFLPRESLEQPAQGAFSPFVSQAKHSPQPGLSAMFPNPYRIPSRTASSPSIADAGSSSASADNQNVPAVPNQDMYTSAVRPVLKHQIDIFVEGSMLWWQASEDGLAFLQDNIHFQPSGILNEDTLVVKEPKFSWDFGFQVGAGYNMPYDGWDLYASWTLFHPKDSKRSASIPADANGNAAIGPSPVFYPLFDFFSEVGANLESQPGSSTSAKWKLRLDYFDAEFGRESKFGKHLCLRPHAGLRSVWIDQTLTVTSLFFFDPRTVSNSDFVSENKCNFWGLGPRVGLDMQWNFGVGLSLFSDLALASLYGHYSTSINETATPDVGTGRAEDNTNAYKRKSVARFAGDFDIGLRWQRTFHNSHRDFLGLMLQAGWETHHFLNQNQFVQGLASVGNTVNQGDLTTQGLTIKARLDF